MPYSPHLRAQCKVVKTNTQFVVCKQTSWSSASSATDLALVQHFLKVCVVVLHEAVVDYDGSFSLLKIRRVRQ